MKLWFFRTPEGRYGLTLRKPLAGDFAMMSCGYAAGAPVWLFDRKPKGMPKLAKGECIPVTMTAERTNP